MAFKLLNGSVKDSEKNNVEKLTQQPKTYLSGLLGKEPARTLKTA
jgi:hypothetical protein